MGTNNGKKETMCDEQLVSIRRMGNEAVTTMQHHDPELQFGLLVECRGIVSEFTFAHPDEALRFLHDSIRAIERSISLEVNSGS